MAGRLAVGEGTGGGTRLIAVVGVWQILGADQHQAMDPENLT
jgi:hypothetical protein